MELNNRFHEIFPNKPIIGMIHLAGDNPVKRALEEIAVYEEEGVGGVIIENYHGSVFDVHKTLTEASKQNYNLAIGVNILPNDFSTALFFADKYRGDLVQIDYIAGQYEGSYYPTQLDTVSYTRAKELFPDIVVLGGVWPKYYRPLHGSDLETDLKQGVQRAEAIVVTGEGTGKETPLDKIKYFRKVIGSHPLIVGAGLNPDNAYEQLSIADGAIVGSWFKAENNTYNPLDRAKIKALMDIVKLVNKP